MSDGDLINMTLIEGHIYSILLKMGEIPNEVDETSFPSGAKPVTAHSGALSIGRDTLLARQDLRKTES